MKPSSLYGHIVELLGLTARSRRPADEIVAEFFRSRRYLGARDRRFISEAVFDIIRNGLLLRHVGDLTMARLPEGEHSPALPVFLQVTSYLLVVRKEEKATVADGLSSLWETYVRGPSLAMSLDELTAVWKAFPWPDQPAANLALRYSIDPGVTTEWVERYGETVAGNVCRGSNGVPPTVARVNTLKCTRDECRARLSREGIETAPTLLSPDGLRFPRRLNLQASPAHRDGWFEMQDEGSQLISYLVSPKPGESILDACAGGGGKTLHLAALMGNRGVVYAFDQVRERLAHLEERKRRAGASVVHIIAGDPATDPHDPSGYHGVLIDAPCSGTGTYRRNPWLKSTYDTAAVERLVQTQADLLDRYAPAVRPGGRLIYATCSLLRKENAGQVEMFLKTHPEFSLVPADDVLGEQGIAARSEQGSLLLLPMDEGTDGYFAAVMKKGNSEGKTPA
jgi:16S rRNA (cytosine967-C5)-methyltransferase